MKKTVLQIAAALLLTLTLTACSQLLSDAIKGTEGPTAPVYTQGDESQPTGADTSPEGPTKPAEPEMLGYDEFGFSVWPEGNYLTDPKFDTDEYLPDFDVDNSMRALGLSANACSTPETIYAASYSVKDGMFCSFMDFADKATGIVAPLCGRPECTHDDETCNAYTGYYAYGLRIYDGKLWWVTKRPYKSEPELRCMALDGTEHETVATLEKSFDSQDYLIHRGYVYASQLGRRVLDGKTAFSFNVVAYSMEDGHMITILDQIHEGEVYAKRRYITVLPVGNDLIILLSGEDERGDGETVVTTQLFRWSSKMRRAELLYSAEKGEWDFVSGANDATVYPAGRDGLYFVRCIETEDPNAPTCIRGDRVHDGSRADFTLMLLSFKTGEFEEISSFSVFNGKTSKITRDYIAVNGSNQDGLLRQLIYDYDGNLLSVSVPIFDYTITGGSPIGGDGDYFYRQYGATPESDDIKAGVLAIPVHGGELLDINNTWRPQR